MRGQRTNVVEIAHSAARVKDDVVAHDGADRFGEDLEIREDSGLGAIEINKMELGRAVANELPRTLDDGGRRRVRETAAAHVERGHDHHGRRFTSAGERGNRSGVVRVFRTRTSDRPGSRSPSPSSIVVRMDTISPPIAVQALRAPGSSASRRPFHAIASPPIRRNGRRYSMTEPSGPTARAVPTSYRPRRALASFSARTAWISTPAIPSAELTSARKRAFFPCDSTSVT